MVDGQREIAGEEVVVEDERDASASACPKEDRVGARKTFVVARAREEAYDARKGEVVVAVEVATAAPSWEAQVKPVHEQKV